MLVLGYYLVYGLFFGKFATKDAREDTPVEIDEVILANLQEYNMMRKTQRPKEVYADRIKDV